MKRFVQRKNLRFWLKEMHRTHGFVNLPRPMAKEDADELKRQIRAFLKPFVSKRVIISDDGDRCIIKLPLPSEIKTAEDADEYFMQNEYIEYEPTYYDCTGQLFTAWYKIFQKPNGEFWAYHSIHRDV